MTTKQVLRTAAAQRKADAARKAWRTRRHELTSQQSRCARALSVLDAAYFAGLQQARKEYGTLDLYASDGAVATLDALRNLARMGFKKVSEEALAHEKKRPDDE